MNHLLKLYQKQPITFTKGEGIWLYDDDGNKYLDALSGIGVCALGHCHPAMTKCIQEQSCTLMHVPNNYHTQQQNQLANKLCEITGLTAAYFSNSGTEANEAAIKMALKYGIGKGFKQPKIIVIDGCFHGRTLGSWSASCPADKSIYGPLMSNFLRASFNDIESIRSLCQSHNDIVAILLEPVLGKGGLHSVDREYLQQVRQLCDNNDCLMMLDEVQSGIARTGKWFAYQHAGIQPDILTTAKALGNGIPIGTYITNAKAASIFSPGDHGSTQGGNAFACRAALTTLETIEQDNLMGNVAAMGDYLRARLSSALKNFPIFKSIQGKGLMIGISLHEPKPDAIKIGLDHGIVFNHAGLDVIRLLPAYIINQEQCDLVCEKLVKVFENL